MKIGAKLNSNNIEFCFPSQTQTPRMFGKSELKSHGGIETETLKQRVWEGGELFKLNKQSTAMRSL